MPDGLFRNRVNSRPRIVLYQISLCIVQECCSTDRLSSKSRYGYAVAHDMSICFSYQNQGQKNTLCPALVVLYLYAGLIQ